MFNYGFKKMTKFLLLFVTLTCFACQGPPFVSVPIDGQFLFKCSDAGSYHRNFFMGNPASVGLESFEMTHIKGMSDICVKNLKGDVLDCDVNFVRERGRDWDFDLQCNKQNFCEVVSERKSDFVESITVYNQNNTAVAARDEAIVPAVNPGDRHWYAFEHESLTIFKFLAYCPDGLMFFASVKICYEDLTKVEIGCGKGGGPGNLKASIESHDVVSTLCFKDKTDEVAQA